MKKLILITLMACSFTLIEAGEKEDHKRYIEVVETVSIQAKRDWPNDYQMQEHVIRKQLASYQEIIKFEKLISQRKDQNGL